MSLNADAVNRWPDRRAAIILWALALGLAAVFCWLIGDLCWRGWQSLSWAFISTAPADAGRSGGIFPIIISTVLILSVTLLAVVPLGICSAVFLSFTATKFQRLSGSVRMMLDLLAGMPSIIFGLFGMVFFGKICGLESSILNGGLTLACMVLPLFVRLSEAAFSSVPLTLTRGASALGLSQWTTLWRVQLPCALPGLLTALLLSLARALAETAALLFTSGYVSSMPTSLLDSGRALSVHIYDLAMNVPGGNAHAAATALVLVMILLVMNSFVTALLRRREHV